jgi:hypothetical protein
MATLFSIKCPSWRDVRGALALLLSSIPLYVPLASAVDSAYPRLLQPHALASETHPFDSLQNTLKAVAASMQVDASLAPPSPTTALQSALQQLAQPATLPIAGSTTRLPAGHMDRMVRRDGNPLSAPAPIPATRQAGLPDQASRRSKVGVDDLRQAMQRLERVNETVMSETFSRVLLGLADMTPMLSDDGRTYPKVSKHDLRERVVMARVNAVQSVRRVSASDARAQAQEIALSASPILAPTASSLADTGLAGELPAQLESPMGDLALGNTKAAAGRSWGDIGASAGLASGAYDNYLDGITLDELGSTSIASLDEAVAADDLRETRAGFVLNTGVKIDFAVTRYTSIDGIDRLHSIANLPPGLNATGLGQAASGRFSNTQVLGPETGRSLTLIQNDLNDRRIMDITEIDIGIDNFGLRAIDFVRPSLLNDAVPAELRR